MNKESTSEVMDLGKRINAINSAIGRNERIDVGSCVSGPKARERSIDLIERGIGAINAAINTLALGIAVHNADQSEIQIAISDLVKAGESLIHARGSIPLEWGSPDLSVGARVRIDPAFPFYQFLDNAGGLQTVKTIEGDMVTLSRGIKVAAQYLIVVK